MRVPAPICAFAVCLTLGATGPGSASAQVPTVESQPRVAVPAREAVIKAAPPSEAPAPVAETPGQPPAAPTAAAPTEPAPVSAAPPPSGVTQLPPAAAPPATASTSQAATSKDRSYVSGRSALTLDGGVAGWLKATEGGGVSADVVAEGPSAGGATKKHISAPKFDNISLQVGWEAKPLLDWVAASWKGGPQPKNGRVSFMDFDYKERSAREFTHALVTETTFPTLDGSSKDLMYLTVKLAPETIRLIPGSGAQATSTPSAARQKAWMPANFRLELPGLDVSKVQRIESFTVGQQVTEPAVGENRVSQKEAGGIEFPSLKIAIAETAAKTWVDWSEDFIVKGNNGDDKEKNGAIVFLDPSLKNELGRVNLLNCGIAGLGPERQVANAEAVRRMTAEIYCERMELVVK